MRKIKALIELGRYDNPTGWVLLFIPALLGYLVNYSSGHFPFKYILLCLLGSMVVRGAGCSINDIWDRNFDKAVERTKTRPVASSRLSIYEALIFFVLQLLCALFILLQFPAKAIIVGVLAVPFIIVYPLMKRFIGAPQLFLGITFSIPILFAAYSLDSFNKAQTIILFIMHTIMVVAYDTVYAHQDIDDDIKVGVKSTAITLSKYNKPFILISYLAISLCLALLGFLGGYNSLFFILNLLATVFVFYNVLLLNLSNKKQCLNFFKLNQYIGVFIAAMILVGRTF